MNKMQAAYLWVNAPAVGSEFSYLLNLRQNKATELLALEESLLVILNHDRKGWGLEDNAWIWVLNYHGKGRLHIIFCRPQNQRYLSCSYWWRQVTSNDCWVTSDSICEWFTLICLSKGIWRKKRPKLKLYSSLNHRENMFSGQLCSVTRFL